MPDKRFFEKKDNQYILKKNAKCYVSGSSRYKSKSKSSDTPRGVESFIEGQNISSSLEVKLPKNAVFEVDAKSGILKFPNEDNNNFFKLVKGDSGGGLICKNKGEKYLVGVNQSSPYDGIKFMTVRKCDDSQFKINKKETDLNILFNQGKIEAFTKLSDHVGLKVSESCANKVLNEINRQTETPFAEITISYDLKKTSDKKTINLEFGQSHEYDNSYSFYNYEQPAKFEIKEQKFKNEVVKIIPILTKMNFSIRGGLIGSGYYERKSSTDISISPGDKWEINITESNELIENLPKLQFRVKHLPTKLKKNETTNLIATLVDNRKETKSEIIRLMLECHLELNTETQGYLNSKCLCKKNKNKIRCKSVNSNGNQNIPPGSRATPF